jgi:predicted metal-dependent hydrolase
MSKIEVRRLNFNFSANTQRYWFNQSVFKTHLFNSFTIFIPEIEKYLILNVKKRINFLDNPQLKQEAQAFICQEGQHSYQHTKFWNNLRASGYKFDTYLRWVQTILFDILERQMSLNFNLAIAAGIEHLTTLIAEFALETDLFAEAEPKLKQLFEWHALEELEHKTVLYDVLQNATNNYLLRQLGMFLAHILILLFLNLGLAMLLYQDRKLFERKVWQEFIEFWLTKDKFLYKALFNARDYLRKDFHPSQKDNLFLIYKVKV